MVEPDENRGTVEGSVPVSAESVAAAFAVARQAEDKDAFARMVVEHLERIAAAVDAVPQEDDVAVMNSHEIGVFADIPCEFWQEDASSRARVSAWQVELEIDEHLDGLVR